MDGVSLFAFSPEGIAKMVKKAAGKLPIRFCHKNILFHKTTLFVKFIFRLYLNVLRRNEDKLDRSNSVPVPFSIVAALVNCKQKFKVWMVN